MHLNLLWGVGNWGVFSYQWGKVKLRQNCHMDNYKKMHEYFTHHPMSEYTQIKIHPLNLSGKTGVYDCCSLI